MVSSRIAETGRIVTIAAGTLIISPVYQRINIRPLTYCDPDLSFCQLLRTSSGPNIVSNY